MSHLRAIALLSFSTFCISVAFAQDHNVHENKKSNRATNTQITQTSRDEPAALEDSINTSMDIPAEPNQHKA